MASRDEPDENSSGNRGIEALLQNVEEMEAFVGQVKNRTSQQDWEHDIKDPMERVMGSINIKDERNPSYSGYRETYNTNPRGRGKMDNRFNLRRGNWKQRNYFSGSNSNNWRFQERHVPRGQYDGSSFSNDRYRYSDSYSDSGYSNDHHFSRFNARGRHYSRPKNNLNYFESDGPQSLDGITSVSRHGTQGPQSLDGITSVSRQGSQSEVSPSQLAKKLSGLGGCEATLLTLMDDYNFDHRKVRDVVSANSQVFEIEGELVRLSPKLDICKTHMDSDGCQSLKTCNELHLCPKFVIKRCVAGDCLFGHSFFTNHNKKVLTKFHLNLLLQPELLNLLKVGSTNKDIKVCASYNNEGGCLKVDCEELHFCLKDLARLCSRNDCTLNHDVSTDKVASVLAQSGISLNEAPRDILLNIASCPLVKDQIETLKTKLKSSGNQDSTSQSSKPETNDSSESTAKANPLQSSTKEPKPPLKTVWAHEFKGEVTLVEICYNSVEGFCPYEESGCWRLHCSLHFYWQVKARKDKNIFWVNLTKEQVMALEKAFCDPDIEKVNLPPLDPASIPLSSKGLLILLNGRSKWQADLEKMELILSGNKMDVLDIRRLCTEDTNNQVLDPCTFKWLFLDKNSKWIEYGQADSTGEEKLKSDVNSVIIESKFQHSPTNLLHFNSESFKYSLDFQLMVQKNLQTNVVRKVRRRPMPHLKDETSSASDDKLPVHWEVMQPEERVKRVVLAHSSKEYGKIASFVQAQGGSLNILKIERVQNPYLWKAFQNKVEEMTSLYKDKNIVDVRQLFHGTKPDIVSKVCQENFDWRLHGTSAGQAYGRGTYFSPLPSTSYSYTSPDPQNNNRYMFIAQVAVGTMTTGNPSMARPPINTVYNIPFDSTAESNANPSIIVKYDKQEYYPEYILTLT